MSEAKPNHCAFCGAERATWEPWDFDKHLKCCRIRRFNKACDAIAIGILSHDTGDYSTCRVVAEAKDLVAAIEKEAHGHDNNE